MIGSSRRGRTPVKTDFVPTSPDVLGRRLQAFESAYSMPTERMLEAFTEGGRLVETDDFHEWALIADTLAALSEPIR